MSDSFSEKGNLKWTHFIKVINYILDFFNCHA